MSDKDTITGPVLAIATYRAKKGCEQELLELVKNHLPTLRQVNLITDRQNYLAQSQDGTLIEIFEWKSSEAAKSAHSNPVVGEIWEKMMLVAEFPPLNGLPETVRPFPGFTVL